MCITCRYIITSSGTTVDSHVELFNGQTGLYLKVVSQGSGYTVRVAYRKNVSIMLEHCSCE